MTIVGVSVLRCMPQYEIGESERSGHRRIHNIGRPGIEDELCDCAVWSGEVPRFWTPLRVHTMMNRCLSVAHGGRSSLDILPAAVSECWDGETAERPPPGTPPSQDRPAGTRSFCPLGKMENDYNLCVSREGRAVASSPMANGAEGRCGSTSKATLFLKTKDFARCWVDTSVEGY